MTERHEPEPRFNRAIDGLADLGVAVERLLQELLLEGGVQPHSVTHRVKSHQSAQRKWASRGASPSYEMTDMLGLRVITYMRDEVDAVAEIIEREFRVDQANSVDKRTALDPDRFGYLSLHYVVSLNDQRTGLTEYRRFESRTFEIQIRSILQHAWAEIEHDLGYKSAQAIPREVRRSFSRLAGLLEIADDEFVDIREQLTSHRAVTDAEVGRGEAELGIDQDSIFSYIQSAEKVQELDRFIARDVAGAKEIEPAERRYAGTRAVELQRVGFHTLAEVGATLEDRSDELKAFSRAWLLSTYPEAAELPEADGPFWEPEDDDSPPSQATVFDADLHAGFGDALAEAHVDANRDIVLDADRMHAERDSVEFLERMGWPSGVSLFHLYLLTKADLVLARARSLGRWPQGLPTVNKHLALCLAAVRGEEALPA